MLRDKFSAVFDAKGPERCGVILASGQIAELPNIHPTPHDAFAFDASVLNSPEVVATWHTHPRTGPNLSVEDYRMFKQWPRLGHLVISTSDVWLFIVNDDILVRYGNPTSWLSERTASRPDPG